MSKTVTIPEKRDGRWQERFVFEGYRLARTGAANSEIAAALGVAPATLKRFLRDHSALAEALEAARGDHHGVEQFQEYVYGRLSPELKALWDKLRRLEQEPNGVARVEAMLERAGMRARQHLFVHALISYNFNPSDACRAVNVSRRTFDRWRRTDPEFVELVDEIHWHKRNFFEGHLCALVAAGNASATVFANKSLNADRGYATKVTVEGSVRHVHAVVSVDDLGLDLETRKKILEAYRAKQGPITVDAPALPAYEPQEGDERET